MMESLATAAGTSSPPPESWMVLTMSQRSFLAVRPETVVALDVSAILILPPASLAQRSPSDMELSVLLRM